MCYNVREELIEIDFGNLKLSVDKNAYNKEKINLIYFINMSDKCWLLQM